jgi:P27 family predicted phage terminase small subunit
MRGRKPHPTRQRVLLGNPGKRTLNLAEPLPPPLPAPADAPPPIELEGNTLALKEWARLAPMLHRLRLVSEADRSALVAVCVEWARYLEATAKVRTAGMVVKTPSGYPMPNPYLSIASKALAACARLWPELGLTPSSRSRVSGDGPGPGGDAFSDFDQPLPRTGLKVQ